jgi:hypothetical protein
MPSAASSHCDLTPIERRRQIATLLAQGVIRHRRRAEMADVGQFSRPRDTGLELVSKTRLSVSKGLTNSGRDSDCEVNDEQDA